MQSLKERFLNLLSQLSLAAFVVLATSFGLAAPTNTGSKTPSRSCDALLEALANASDNTAKDIFRVKVGDDRGQAKTLPLTAADFQNTRFAYGRHPQEPLPQGVRVLGPIQYGYDLSDENFRRFGKVNYLTVDEQNNVIEVGGGSDKQLQDFKAHARGRILSQSEIDTIAEINSKIFSELRANPEAQKKLEEFSQKRGWPRGLAEKAGLVYYSKDIIDLKAWASDHSKGNHYSLNQLRDAGWLLLTFDNKGRPVYKDETSDSIKIPYFKDAKRERFELWQSRMLTGDEGPRYRTWQIDRSILNNPARVTGAAVYNWNPEAARGKTVVITEGALKCIIGEETTGLMHVGIEGITQFNEALAKAFVASGATSFIVALDRDPAASDYFRIDNISDSRRASYEIAEALEKAGATKVRIAQLPDVFDGDKVGIDDLILAEGASPYISTLNNAVTPQDYARLNALDVELMKLKHARKELREALKIYSNTLGRTGSHSAEQIELLREAKAASAKADGEFKQYLRKNFNGARSLHEPTTRFPSIPQASPESQAALELKAFANPILIFDYRLSDQADLRCQPGPCLKLNFGSAILEGAYAYGVSRTLDADIRRALPIAKAAGFKFSKTEDDFATFLLAGRMAHDFPPASYRFEFNVLFKNGDTVPLIIYKKSSGMAVAMARLPTTQQITAQQRQLFLRLGSYLRPSGRTGARP